MFSVFHACFSLILHGFSLFFIVFHRFSIDFPLLFIGFQAVSGHLQGLLAIFSPRASTSWARARPSSTSHQSIASAWDTGLKQQAVQVHRDHSMPQNPFVGSQLPRPVICPTCRNEQKIGHGSHVTYDMKLNDGGAEKRNTQKQN